MQQRLHITSYHYNRTKLHRLLLLLFLFSFLLLRKSPISGLGLFCSSDFEAWGAVFGQAVISLSYHQTGWPTLCIYGSETGWPRYIPRHCAARDLGCANSRTHINCEPLRENRTIAWVNYKRISNLSYEQVIQIKTHKIYRFQFSKSSFHEDWTNKLEIFIVLIKLHRMKYILNCYYNKPSHPHVSRPATSSLSLFSIFFANNISKSCEFIHST